MDENTPRGANWRVRVLVVEDDKDLQKIMKINLEHEGFEVIQAFDGKEAVRLVAEILPDVVLLDLMMPEMDGFEVCKRLKALDSTRYIPVLVLSAKDAIKDKLQCFSFQADDYMVKPYEYDELGARIYLHLNKAIDQQEVRERDKARAVKLMLAEVSTRLIDAGKRAEQMIEGIRQGSPTIARKRLDKLADEVMEMVRITERMREENDPLYDSPYLEKEASDTGDDAS